MRWDALFDDLESQFAAARGAADEAGVVELLRLEQARVEFADRLAGQLAQLLKVRTANGQSFAGQLTHVGAEWLVLADSGQSFLVPFASVQSVEGLGRRVGTGPAGISARLGLASALRALARDRAHVNIYAGSPVTAYEGTVDRVGRDFLELALVPSGEQRRAGTVTGVLALPFTAVSAVASLPS